MFDSTDIDARVKDFTDYLVSQRDDAIVVRQKILHGNSFAIDEATHFGLKQTVAEKFGIDVSTDVFMVGSAKMGFSLAPTKRFRHFRDKSDIDLAIINHDLYKRIWHEVHAYKESGADWPEQATFEKYLSWGWIRPDKLPRSASFEFANEWWDFFRGLQASRAAGPYKIAAALYHDFPFFVKYQQRSVAACRTGTDGV
jgi:hypothetical protein